MRTPRNIPRSPAGVLVLLVVLVGGWLWVNGVGEQPEMASDIESATVSVDRVVDGDTAKVWMDGRSEYVRYIGIDTPESVKPDSPIECYGEEAKRFNQQLLDRSSQVELIFDEEKRDQHGRLLAYVYSGPTLLQAELLRRGYATTILIPPNDAKAEEFTRLEDEAREAGRGLWSAC